jgi:hypothetical protein
LLCGNNHVHIDSTIRTGPRAAFILAFETGLRPGGELRYERPGFVLSLRATGTKH